MVSQGVGPSALGLFGLKCKKKCVGKKDKNKRNEKTEEAYFCQVFPGLVIVSVLSRFVWIRLSFVCHGLGTSVSNLVNLCI